MAYKDILPTTNLQAVDIRDTIGCPSNNLAHYCCMAKTGGKQYGTISLAFETIEVGSYHHDGSLISGAVAYFNIYSNNAPGEWTIHLGDTKYMLRRNVYGDTNINGVLFSSISYCYDLGAFKGYVAKSSAPYFESAGGLTDSEDINTVVVGFYRGDYDRFSMVQKFFYDVSLENLYVGLSNGSSTLISDTFKYIDWAKNSSSGGTSGAFVSVNRKPPSITSAVNLYRKMGETQMKQLMTLPMESNATGNGQFTFSSSLPIIWTEYDKNPKVIGVVFCTGSRTNPGTRVYSSVVEVTRGGFEQGVFHFELRVVSDRALRRNGNPSASLSYPESSTGDPAGYVTIPAGMHFGQPVSYEEADNGFEQGTPTWEISGSAPYGSVPAVALAPYHMSVELYNIEIEE